MSEPMKNAQYLALMAVLDEVRAERARQHEKWGEQNLQDFIFAASASGDRRHLEGRRASNDQMVREGVPLTFEEILDEEFHEVMCERDPARLRAELVQVAAVAVQWIECLDRRGGR